MSSFHEDFGPMMSVGTTKAPLLSIERVVALATPVFAALSAFLVAWVGKHFPGLPKINGAQATALMVTGAAGAVGVVYKWLHGRQVFTQIEQQAAHIGQSVTAELGPGVMGDLHAELESHKTQILSAVTAELEKVAAGIHAPPSVDQIIAAMMQRIGGSPPPVPAQPQTWTPEQVAQAQAQQTPQS